MEARMYFRKKTSGGRVYLQIAESRRVAGRVQQRVITTLGRLDELEASGQIKSSGWCARARGSRPRDGAERGAR